MFSKSKCKFTGYMSVYLHVCRATQLVDSHCLCATQNTDMSLHQCSPIELRSECDQPRCCKRKGCQCGSIMFIIVHIIPLLIQNRRRLNAFCYDAKNGLSPFFFLSPGLSYFGHGDDDTLSEFIHPFLTYSLPLFLIYTFLNDSSQPTPSSHDGINKITATFKI